MENKTNNSTIIVGKNAVMEVLRSGREIDKVLVVHGAGNSLAPILAKCRQNHILVKEVAPQKLDFLSGGAVHQGVGCFVAEHSYCEVGDILQYAEERHEPPFLLLCDSIEDPHNLGAIIRTAEAVGAHGIILPKHRAVSVTPTVAKAASGALEYMRIARVTNLNQTIAELKKNGIWVFAADMDGETWCETDCTVPLALVIGSEGRGVSALVKKNCDKAVSMPMFGHINSLNASVAAAVLMYEVVRQRKINI
ncbi:MAG: 23S rRNA (guanosine(2251)-2'-O)-methyltransferase RlmB [Clostridia bacterium]|nr:23S rRNA (guanosine(2251)-2'-O)-methyltransferase RlmB [Clostridia bacterium]